MHRVEIAKNHIEAAPPRGRVAPRESGAVVRAYRRHTRQLRLNQWALAGDWTVERGSAVLNEPGGRVAYRFHARDVHLVMGPATPGSSVKFRVLIDGQPPGANHGVDVDEQGFGTVTEQRMYTLVRQGGAIADRQFEIEFLDAGAEAFAFSFG